MSVRDAVAHAIHHPMRKRLIGALWHSSEALSAERFHGEYLAGEEVPLGMVSYHVKMLEKDGIVKLEREEPTEAGSIERFFVLDGPNSGEAIRRLQLISG